MVGLVLPARLNEFVVIFVSIVLQSLPFVLLGVFASAAVQRHLSEGVVTRWLPRRVLPLVAAASVFGLVAPVCDCGVIPLARRLTAKGLPLYAATTFIVAAPVVNPVVLVATAFAFHGNWTIVALRMAMTLSVAVTIGVLVSALFPGTRSLVPAADPIRGGSGPLAEARGGPVRGLVADASAEYFDIVFFVILGALFTAAAQTFVPRGDLTALGRTPVGSVLALMPVASVLSICSEADAFVARAFAGTFSVGAVLAFMTIGQIVDLRNGFLLARTLPARLVALIVVVSYGLVLAEGALVNALLPWP